ncbi:Prolamin-like domain containing protein [Trema orientale]|uniref:Prolamin-like domain containing protein n=1 Tax=Trema orientale TaxID=63057 RepID=A0A2P5CW45_TREOI|nr:Prolamin-like domain containing protein [Trema orientale]
MEVFCLATRATAIMLMLQGVLVVTTSTAAPPPVSEFLHDCEVKIASCGKEIFLNIVKNATVTTACCHRLVFMGKPCHDGLVSHLVSLPSFKGNKAQLLAAAQRIWDYCASVPY